MARTTWPRPPTPLAARVLRQAIENGEEDFGSPAWLNENDTFDHRREFADPEAVRRAKDLLELLPLNRERRRNWERKQSDAEILCANLLANKSRRFAARKPLAISRDRNSYKPNRYTRASYFVTELVKVMVEDGWIAMETGYHSKNGGRMSRIWPTQKLLDHFNPFDQVDFRPLELVNLRDESHQNVEYKDTVETNQIREVLRQANIVNRRAQVQLKTPRGFQQLNTDLYAVFNVTFEKGGRLYTGKNGYQSLPREDRSHIWINRRPTVELDFSGMHPRLLYALEGILYPDDGDPYSAVHDSPELRPFLKQLLLALLNSESTKKAVAAGNYELYLDYELYLTLKAIGHRTTELIERFKQAHPDIAHYFCQGMGLKLMRMDARIALDVVAHFTSRGVPILSIHDSFIVERERQEELREAMQAAYRVHSGGFQCPIKEG